MSLPGDDKWRGRGRRASLAITSSALSAIMVLLRARALRQEQRWVRHVSTIVSGHWRRDGKGTESTLQYPRSCSEPSASRRTGAESGVFAVAGSQRNARSSARGSESYYYSGPSVDGRPELDDLITDMDPGLSLELREMRPRAPGMPVEPDAAASCRNLTFRTAHVRNTFEDGLVRVPGAAPAARHATVTECSITCRKGEKKDETIRFVGPDPCSLRR